MTIFRFKDPIRIVRRVTVDASGSVAVNDTTQGWWRAEFSSPTGRDHRTGVSPRTHPAWTLRYRVSQLNYQGDPLKPADRVEGRNVVWEVLEDSRPIFVGDREVGYEVRVTPITKLYPITGSLQELDGTVVNASMAFSAFAADETHDRVGTFENLRGEAPVSATGLKANRKLVAGAYTFKITAAELDRTGLFYSLELRRAGLA